MTTAAITPKPSGPPYRRSMRNYLLDSRFQLKYTGFLVAVAIVISGVMGAVLYETTRAVVVESTALVDESRKVSEVSRMNMQATSRRQPGAADGVQPGSRRARQDHRRPAGARSFARQQRGCSSRSSAGSR